MKKENPTILYFIQENLVLLVLVLILVILIINHSITIL